MQILADAPLFAPAGLEDRFLEVLALCPVDSRRNHVPHRVMRAGKDSGRPTDKPARAIARNPVAFKVIYWPARPQLLEYRTQPLALFREKQIPEVFPFDLFKRVAGRLLTSAVEPHNSP